jgi:hypothetical protein
MTEFDLHVRMNYIHHQSTSRKPVVQVGGRSCIIFSLSLPRLMKMCLNEAYSRVRVGKYLLDVFPIKNGLKQGGGLLPLLFFALEYAVRGFR